MNGVMPHANDGAVAAPDGGETVSVPSASSARYSLKDHASSSHMAILDFAGQGRGRWLLDVGVADGFLAKRLTEQGWHVAGIERDPQSAALARRHCKEVVVADLNHDVPRWERRFDLIVYGDVLEHLLSPEQVFQDLNRLLAPDGTVIVSMPNIAHLWVRLMLLCGRFEYQDRGILDRTHVKFFTLKSFRRFFEQCGIDMTKFRSVPVPLYLVVPPRFHGRWLDVFQRIHALAACCWPGGLGYQFVAQGRRS